MPIQTHHTIPDLPGLRTILRGGPHAEPRQSIGGVALTVIHEVLVAALAEIETPDRWCKNSPAVLRSGAAVRDIDDIAIYPRNWLERKCSEGAVHYAAFWQGHHSKVALKAVDLLEGYTNQALYDWNDQPERLHAEVVGLFRTAIANLAREFAA